jgi:hypothetical protein
MHARKKGTHPAYQRARAIGSALEAVTSLRVRKAHSGSDARSHPATLGCTSKHPLKTGLAKQVCGRRKQERASDSCWNKKRQCEIL